MGNELNVNLDGLNIPWWRRMKFLELPIACAVLLVRSGDVYMSKRIEIRLDNTFVEWSYVNCSFIGDKRGNNVVNILVKVRAIRFT